MRVNDDQAKARPLLFSGCGAVHSDQSGHHHKLQLTSMSSAATPIGFRLSTLAVKCIAAATLSLTAFAALADDIADVQKLLAAGKNPEALQKADQYLQGKPRDPMMRFLRGISLSQAGRTAEIGRAHV